MIGQGIHADQNHSINSNAYKLAFWVLAYVLYDPSLHSRINAEVQQVLCKDGFPSSAVLENRINKCSLLVSVYNELLRINTASATIPSVLSDTDFGRYQLRKAATTLVFYRQMHFEEAAFGPNAAEFDATRFAKNEELIKSPSFRPLSGGTTYCSGRTFPKRKVLRLVAMGLYNYDITVPEISARHEKAGA